MTLHINTTQNDLIKISLKDKGKLIASKKIKSNRTQAEKLLPAIEAMLKNKKIDLRQIKQIEVENRGGSFTSLRIGVITANALGYALGIPVEGNNNLKTKAKKISFSIVAPLYDRAPEITKKKIRST